MLLNSFQSLCFLATLCGALCTEQDTSRRQGGGGNSLQGFNNSTEPTTSQNGAIHLMQKEVLNRLKKRPTGHVKLGKESANFRSVRQTANVSETVGGYNKIPIGKNKFAVGQVTDIGDIDSNGIRDYIVADVGKNNHSGSIRLYFMNENDRFFYSRELTPGRWGFKGRPLNSGDLFGSAVFRIPDSGFKIPHIIVVGAPGDNNNTGAVYFLMISPLGEVTSSAKVTPSKRLRSKSQIEIERGFGSVLEAVHDLNGNGLVELAIRPERGMTTVLFLGSRGEPLLDQVWSSGLGTRSSLEEDVFSSNSSARVESGRFIEDFM